MGSSTVDAFAATAPSDESVIDIRSGNVERELMAYPLGSKILIQHLDSYIGGGGTNTAVCFSRLGLKTGYVGKLGKDINGFSILRCLKEEGVTFLGAVGKRSGFSFILDSQAHDRTVFTFRGCNDELRYEEVKVNQLDTTWLYSSSLIGESFETLVRVARVLKARGVKVAFNPSTYLVKKGLDVVGRVLSLCDVVVLNKEEAQILVGSGEVDFLLKKLLQEVGGIVIVTDGARGSFASDGKLRYFVAPRDVQVVESTGAGDAFASTFVAGLAWEKPIIEAMVLAQINAESVIQKHGAKNGLLRRSELLSLARKRSYITRVVEVEQ
ncbi:carbohydrate kinase family protein [Candidatus Woesearchaeota archaeon]|nr:MAG: carbohydrate kinase family protein [Candidatus Woesearchaeota archaeon]